MTREKEVRFKENPFVDALNVTTKGKRITVAPLGEDNSVLVNQITGEVKATSISTFKQVDDAKFLKLFAENIALTFDLKSAGIKAFNILCFALQKEIRKDTVELDKYVLEDFIEYYESRDPPVSLRLSEATFMRGLKELEKAQIIAKTLKRGRYFINPSFVFNGNRLVFTTIIERKSQQSEEQLEIPTPQ